MKPYIALTIAGSDSGGGAGIQADLKTFAALKVHGLSVITSVTAQNTQRVEEILDLQPEFVGKQFDTLAEDFDIEWAKTGMISNSKIVRVLKNRVKEHGIKLVVDPVMIATSGSPLVEEGTIGELTKLFGKAELVTPNIPEAEELAEMKIKTVKNMREAAERISELGPEGVLMKGGHLNTPKIHNILFYNDEFTEYKEPRVPVPGIHGTGCTLSAAITAKLARGNEMKSAVKKAVNFMAAAVRGRLEIGKGFDVTNPLAQIWKVTGGGREIEDVQKAAENLTNSHEFAHLIPEVGTNVAMAPRGASKTGDVIGLTGRIIKVQEKPYLSGIPAAGGSEHVANFVLTAMKHNSQMRAGMNIRFSEEILKTCRDLNLKISNFDRKKEPTGVKTMKWGTERAIEKFGGVPDIIYDEGAMGKEPMIRIIGEEAFKVSETALQIAEKTVR